MSLQQFCVNYIICFDSLCQN